MSSLTVSAYVCVRREGDGGVSYLKLSAKRVPLRLRRFCRVVDFQPGTAWGERGPSSAIFFLFFFFSFSPVLEEEENWGGGGIFHAQSTMMCIISGRRKEGMREKIL